MTSKPAALPPCITVNPKIQFGRPCLAGTGIPALEVADRFRAGESREELAWDFSITLDQVEDAIHYQRTRKRRRPAPAAR